MKVIEIKDLTRKESPIYYRRYYSGTVSLDIMGKIQDCKLDFVIETTAFGTSEVSISNMEDVDYPKLPLIKELKSYISSRDSEGAFPV
jgi:hypothetical protein